jgi:hypothetical protein
MATPLIRLPQEQGGTMYAFSSAARDLTRAYYNPDLVFEYSKFALLDLPVVSSPSPGSTNNYIQFDNLFEGGAVGIAPNYKNTVPDDNANRHFAQTFQNYALNLENSILNDDDFDDTLYSSDAEKVLFKWLNHIGAFRVRTATSQEAASGFSRVIEENNSELTGSEYSKLVQYIGDIDVSNDKNYQGNTYNEIFINVPSSVGYTPEVLFKASAYNTTATQYQPGLNADSFINGRSGQTHPDPNINLGALADNADGNINLDINETYHYGIDFDPSAYAKIVNDSTLNNLFDYSKRGGDFRFNAILVYYDVYSKSNAGNKSTNLYGIIILDNWKLDPGSTGWYIPEFTKYKPNEVTGLNGNAYALKLNVKFNSSLDNVGVEKNINDFSTFSMDIFFDTTSSLEQASKILIETNRNYSDLVKRFADLETLFLTQLEQEDLVFRINNLETAIENASLNFSSASDILDMISSTNQRLNQIINGEIPTEVQYNTDVLKAGDGIKIDKSNTNSIKIHNTNYGYSLNELYSYEISTGQILLNLNSETPFNPSKSGTEAIWTRIKKYDNLVRIYLELTEVFDNNLNIYLDDTVSSFKKGQTIKFTFKTPILNLNNNSINIYADKQNGWILKASIPASELLSNKPYIEMICVDEINKTFELEIIR